MNSGTGARKVIQVPAVEPRKRPSVLVVARAYDAELWLVHRKPDGTEIVQQQTARVVGFGGASVDYAFPPVQVTTSQGAITLDITGKLQVDVGDMGIASRPSGGQIYYFFNSAGSDAQPAMRIMLSISRRARAAGPPVLDITGGSSMVIDVPAPTDVLSFEFPALQKATEDLLKEHQFSLRVRVTPVAR